MSNNPTKITGYVRLHSKEWILKNCEIISDDEYNVTAYSYSTGNEDGVCFVDDMFKLCDTIVLINQDDCEEVTGRRVRSWMCREIFTLEEMEKYYPEYLV